MICPRCQCTDYYKLAGRKFVRCASCRHDFSETSGTIWKYQKMEPAKHQEIVDRLEQGENAHAISLSLGIQYKTVWGIKKKIQEDHDSKRPFREPADFRVGDVVSRIDSGGAVVAAVVSGFCENEAFVRVRDDGGRHRIWKKDNLMNDDDELRRLEPHLR